VVPEVRKAQSGEVAELAGTLARAFHDDPVFSWLIPGDERRAKLLPPGFELFLRRLWLPHEETYTSGPLEGGAAWEPPGTWKLGVGEQIQLLPSILRAWGRSAPRALAALGRLEKGHPEEPHLYLAMLGVAPESQGRGLGSILMHPVLSRCDREGIPAYLEASSERSRDLYVRHGFEVTSEERLGRGSPPVWRMWREPQPEAAAL
jgi:ribosomal protein S18 acetylase RimI-like enzyme